MLIGKRDFVVINIFEWLVSAFKLGRDIRAERSYRTDAFRLEAQRVIDAFQAHGLAPNEVARLLPEALGLNASPAVLGDVTELKRHLNQISPWATATLALDPHWVRGKGSEPHRRIHSYKHISELTTFFREREAADDDGAVGLTERYQLHFYKQDDRPLSESRGTFVVLLTEEFAQLEGESFYRTYYLTEGHHFEHSPCVVHLLQIVAHALHYRVFMSGHVLAAKHLAALDKGNGFASDLTSEASGLLWYPEDVFFRPLDGDLGWNLAARDLLEESLQDDQAEMLLRALPPKRQLV